jgi:phosphopantetheine--protein transferase-like protein
MVPESINVYFRIMMRGNNEDGEARVGIDIEAIANFAVVADYHEDSFYRLNFTAAEIAYCLEKADPLESFAGLFAAKEALRKASHSLLELSLDAIQIEHDKHGRPVFPGHTLSISHSNGFAVAVAVTQPVRPERHFPYKWLLLLSVVCSVAALVLCLKK